MKYFLSRECVLKWLETPSVYHIKKDELYELDEDSFKFLRECSSGPGCSSQDAEFIDYCLNEGILFKDRIILRRPALIKSPEPSLRYLELQITDKCNLKCKHCYIYDKGGSELSPRQIKDILKEFEEMQGLRVLITGGEPFMHRGFEEINAMLQEFFIRKVLFTNGLLLNKKILKGLNVDEMQISIDGLEEAHDSLRGKGTFKSALDAVKRAIDSGFEVSISTMVHPGNLNDFDEMESLFKEMGIKDWTVDVPCITGRLEEHGEFQISPEVGGKYLRYGHGKGLHSGDSGFACGLHLMAVTADGRVSKCTFYSKEPVGIIADGLQLCWQKIKPLRLAELQCDCDHIESCRGGCRYRATLLGDPCGKDFYKCKMYDIL
ncbi:MAG: radical SAM protein [Thermodesulfovibrionales bacterium]